MELQTISKEGSLLFEPISPDIPDDTMTKMTRIQIFLSFALMNIFVNYDTGVVPASLSKIQSELDTNFQETAAIGSFVYVGICVASLFVSGLFHRYSAKRILITSMMLNCLSSFLFAASQNLPLIYISRLIMGFTQAFAVIYAPVWINEYSPKSQSTIWLGILQVAVPVGIAFGYLVASLFIYYSINWRYSIIIQGLMEIPLILSLSLVDPMTLDILHRPNHHEDLPSGFSVLKSHLRLIASNWTYVFLTLGMSSMIFVASGIQYWISLYMTEVLDASHSAVTLGFFLISTTAPIGGVLVGGAISDYLGGYKGDNIGLAMKQSLFFAFGGFTAAGFAGFCTNVTLDYFLLWTLIFFGAAVMPTGTGITVDSLPKELQSSGSALTQFMFNFGGFFLSPLTSAIFMDTIDDRKLALTWGFRFTLSFSIGALSFIVAAFVWVQKKNKRNERERGF